MIENFSELVRDDQEYAYETGVIRVLETRFIDQTHLKRMLEAKNYKDAFSLLHDTTYGKHMKDKADFDAVLEEEYRYFLGFFEKSCKNRYVLEYYKSRYDIHNFKMFIKSKLAGTNLDSSMLSSYGTISVDTFMKVFDSEEETSLPEPYNSFNRNALAFFEESNDIEMLDIYVDSLYFKWRHELIKRSKNLFLINLDREVLTLTNLKSFARIVYFKNSTSAESIFLAGGFIGKSFFTEHISEGLNQVWHYLKNTPYEKIVKDGYSSVVQEGSFALLEKLCENRLVHIARSTKSAIFGVEIVYSFMMAKENEIRTLRIILSGKKNNVSRKIIENRLPEKY
ncbi:V-type ATPase subunit [candidate division WOR-3 bacterium]|nr:V-type ATPase subunit [candidate division WOR-3 bacterium]